MKKTPAIAASCLLSFVFPAMADTFTLKDGTTLEATILKEDPESYYLEVQVTKSIKDERTVPKADVVKVTRERLDLKAFEPIAKLSPAPDFLKEADYTARINTVEKFLKAYPSSTKAKDAAAIAEKLKVERQELASGGIKIGGKIVSKQEYQANAYDFDSRMQEAKIRALIAERQMVPALRLFSEFDKEYRTSLAYGELVPLIKQVIQAHLNEAQEQLASLDARVKERQIGIQRMSSEQRATTEAAIKEQDDGIAAAFKAEKDAKILWVTPSPFNKASLEEAVKYSQTELTRISAVKTGLDMDGGRAFRELYNAVHSDANAAAVAAAVTAAKTALVPVRYITPLEAEAKGRK
ncbi:MAG: hypothetical protein EOP85_06335 [Verrucomicrobiaceae bacterium]|nr:MAG: hypothetical protein EOP85_06335 [Verrucomicrobiaceae bacterium]